jgi:hypothetical protein
MKHLLTSTARSRVMVTLSALGLFAGLGGTAHATPYAFASNQITELRLTFLGGAAISPTTATTSISDSAQFNGFPISGFQNAGTVGNALSIPQAFSGAGSAPPATYTPQGPGTFTGARSDAAIGAGSAATGGIAVNSVAEGFGNALGNSVGTNNAAINFTVTGDGRQLALTFTDLIQLIVSTAALQNESAVASIQNVFSITQQGQTTPFARFAPGDINLQIGSATGVPPNNSVGPASFPETFLSPILLAGVTYDVSFTSTASETIQPGTPISVPEPASLALIGVGLCAAGLIRRRKLH